MQQFCGLVICELALRLKRALSERGGAPSRDIDCLNGRTMMHIKTSAILTLLCVIPVMVAAVDTGVAATLVQPMAAEFYAARPNDVQQAAGLYAQASQACTLRAQRIDGNLKTCIYACGSGDTVITINSTNMCPQTIQR